MSIREASRSTTPPAARRLRVIAVTSGKGGVGKTSICTNLAVHAASGGLRVLVVDADLGLANVEILLGIVPRYSLVDLLEGTASIDEVLADGPHGVKVLPAGSGVPHLASLDEAQKLRLVTSLDPLEDRFDLVLVDSPAGIGDNVLFFVGASQEALLVVTPEPTSLTDAYVAIKAISQRAGVRDFHVAISQSPGERQAREVFEKLGRLTDRFLNARVRYLGSIPRDEHVHRAIMAQIPLVEAYPLAPASRSIARIADRLLAEPPPAHLEGGLKFLWQRLFLELSDTDGN